MLMLEVVVSRIGGNSLQVSQNAVRTLQGKLPQQTAPPFPQLEVGYLNQVLDLPPGRSSPKSGGERDDEANGLMHPGHELLPRLVIARSGTKADNLLQRQRRISWRCGSGRHLTPISRFIGLAKATLTNLASKMCPRLRLLDGGNVFQSSRVCHFGDNNDY